MVISKWQHLILGHKALYGDLRTLWEIRKDFISSLLLHRTKARSFLLKPDELALKHCEIYKISHIHNKELPIPLTRSLGRSIDYEQSGECMVDSSKRITQMADAHIFLPSLIRWKRILSSDRLYFMYLKHFGYYSSTAQISLRDPQKSYKYIGGGWKLEQSRSCNHRSCPLKKVLKLSLFLGEAAFYGT